MLGSPNEAWDGWERQANGLLMAYLMRRALAGSPPPPEAYTALIEAKRHWLADMRDLLAAGVVPDPTLQRQCWIEYIDAAELSWP